MLPPPSPPRFAQVVVLLPIDQRVRETQKRQGGETLIDFSPESQVFTYGIPRGMVGHYHPGQVVWVPFGRARQQGVILQLCETAPAGLSLKPLDEPVSAGPVLTAIQLELALWLSRHYLAPLSECVKLILPPGFGARSQVLVEYAEDAPIRAAELSPAQQALLLRLRRAPMLLSELRQIDRRLAADDVLGALLQDGLVRLRHQVQGRGQPRAQRQRHVRLLLPPDQVEAALADLTRAPRQAEALAWLAGQAGDAPLTNLPSPLNPSLFKRLAERGWAEVYEEEVWRDPLAGRAFAADAPPTLTADQAQAWAAITASLAARADSPPVFLLHGVTGSGKTELYLRALQQVVAGGGQGIVLVPEISLTPQTVRRFAARFPGRVAMVHSKLSEGERYDTWQRAQAGAFDVVIGSRSALFTPFPRIGVIIVDEEHEAAYKQERTPRYHARDAAITLARLCGAVTLLGSATPSLESMFQARRGVYHLLDLPRRVQGHMPASAAGPVLLDLPPVQIVDMRQELRAGNRSMFSRRLRQQLAQTLQRGEQAILFLNRRGSASYVFCRDEGHVLHCPRCAAPLTFHQGGALICHQCNYRQAMPRACPKCGSLRFREFGAGTQSVIDALAAEFPTATPLRWDRDATGGKSSHEAILQDFIDQKANVLVGTQMIAKGLDLPLVTLVGVLSADVGLFLPDFRAGERVFQVLTQVAGRAGRSARGGEVIFQTYQPQHPAILAASGHDYEAFYRAEMHFRQEHGYPPYHRLTRLLFSDSNRERCQQETAQVAARLQQRAAALGWEGFSLIGPAPAFFSKVRGQLRWHLLFRAADPGLLLAGVPLSPQWRIDVDPVDTL